MFVDFSVDGGSVSIVEPSDYLAHDKFLLREVIQISSEDQYLQGPLSELPNRSISIPTFAAIRDENDSKCAFSMTQRDPKGESKISEKGALLGGRKYMCNTFTLKSKNDITFILLKDLLKTLRYDGTEDSFLACYDQLRPVEASESDIELLKKFKLVSLEDFPVNDTTIDKRIRYIIAKSAFVQFGASIILCGTRVVDDYWETLAKEEGFTNRFRVFSMSKKLEELFYILQPHFKYKSLKKNKELHENEVDNPIDNFENPFFTVFEQTSSDIKTEYLEKFSKGDVVNLSLPGQNINGSIEINHKYKVPKYHNRYSFLQATQANAMDIPIWNETNDTGDKTDIESVVASPPSSNSEIIVSELSSVNTNKPLSRMLSSIIDPFPATRLVKKSSREDLSNVFENSDNPLNINGWKFDALPTFSETNKIDKIKKYSHKGIPIFDKDKLIARLQRLTPNQIKELEHVHDSVSVCTGLQSVRELRKKQWTKYWQYKAGVPVGLRKDQYDYFSKVYLKNTLKHTKSSTDYDEKTNCDRTYTTKKIPNSNFLGNCNVKGLHPPYASVSRELNK